MYVPLARAIAAPLATLSLAAAAIHFAVGPEHVVEYAPYGVLFLGLAWFQALWAISYVFRSEPRLNVVAVVVNLGAALVWLWSRTLGLPFGPESGVPEEIGAVDVLATIEEVFLAGLLVSLATRPVREAVEQLVLRPRSAWFGAIFWCAFIVAVTSLVLLEPRPIMTMH